MRDMPSLKIAGADLPMKGTGTGMNGDTYGAELGVEACNCMGEISSATQSDKSGQTMPKQAMKGDA